MSTFPGSGFLLAASADDADCSQLDTVSPDFRAMLQEACPRCTGAGPMCIVDALHAEVAAGWPGDRAGEVPARRRRSGAGGSG
jgi:hypothetical protein